jgi:hypothetical protein
LNVLIDAQRGEFYLAEWELSADKRVEVGPLRIVTTAEKTARTAAGEAFTGPAAEPARHPGAAMVARLAGGRQDFVLGEKMQPIYLRETAFVKAPAARQL